MRERGIGRLFGKPLVKELSFSKLGLIAVSGKGFTYLVNAKKFAI